MKKLKDCKEKQLLENILAGTLTDEMKDIVQMMIDKNDDLLSYLSPENWIGSIKKTR